MLKKIFITLLVLIVLLIVGLGVFLATFDLNHYREFTQKKLSQALNYPVQIGSMHTKLSLIPTIQINNFKVFQNGANPKVILDVPQMEATLEIIPLLKKKIEITKINILLVSLDLSLLSNNKEKTPDKKEKNTSATSSADSSALLNQLWINEITVDRILCRFMNKDKKEAIELNKLSLKGLNKFKFQVNYNQKKFAIEGSAGLITKLIINPKSLPIDLKVTQGGATAILKGQIGDIHNLSKIRINANVTIPKLKSFLKTWNIDVPDFWDVNTIIKLSLDGNMQKMMLKGINLDIAKKALLITADGQAKKLDTNPEVTLEAKVVLNASDLAKKFGIKPFEMTGNMGADQQRLTLKKIDFKAGRSDVTGDFEINWKDFLSIKPNLTSSYLNLNDILDKQASSTANAANTKTTGTDPNSMIPNTKIDWSLLDKFNMKGKIDIGHLFLTDQITDYLNINIAPQLDKGHLSSVFKGRIISGSFNGTIDLQAKQKTVALKLTAQNLDLDKIRSIDKTIKGTKVNADISLSSKGDTVKSLTTNANGQIMIELLGGTIMDKWFNSLPSTLSLAKQRSGLLDFSTADQKTEIICGAVNIPIKDGIVTSNEKIALQTAALNFVANGKINLKNETVDVTVVPSVNQTRGMANQLLTTVQAVHLKGPWKNIEPSVEASQVVENVVQVAAQKLTGQKPEIVTSTALCQKVLGKKIQQTTTTATAKKQAQPATQQKQATSKKESLKQQLMQSLGQALQKAQK